MIMQMPKIKSSDIHTLFCDPKCAMRIAIMMTIIIGAIVIGLTVNAYLLSGFNKSTNTQELSESSNTTSYQILIDETRHNNSIDANSFNIDLNATKTLFQ